MELFGFCVDIARKYVVENDVLYERALVMLVVIKVLYIEKRY